MVVPRETPERFFRRPIEPIKYETRPMVIDVRDVESLKAEVEDLRNRLRNTLGLREMPLFDDRMIIYLGIVGIIGIVAITAITAIVVFGGGPAPTVPESTTHS